MAEMTTGVLSFVDVFLPTDPAELTHEVEGDLGSCDLVVVHVGDFKEISHLGATGLLNAAAVQERRNEVIARLSTTMRLISARPSVDLTTGAPLPCHVQRRRHRGIVYVPIAFFVEGQCVGRAQPAC